MLAVAELWWGIKARMLYSSILNLAFPVNENKATTLLDSLKFW